MILTNCAACAAPLAHNAPRCVRCHTRYCDATCQHDHWRRGHKQICKRIHRGGNAEQYNADKKYKEAVAVAVEACADDTKGQKCYICLEAVQSHTGEGLVRGCGCGDRDGVSSPELGVAHVSCLARQAKIAVEEAEENNFADDAWNERFKRWDTCSLCEQKYYGVVYCALGWACWKTYLSRPEADWARRLALNALGNSLYAAKRHEDALVVREADLAMMRRVGASEQNILVSLGNLAVSYESVGQLEKALRMHRDVYSGHLRLKGNEDYDTLREANNCAQSLSSLKRHEEARSLLRQTIPVARRALGEGNRLTLKMRSLYSLSLCMDPSATLDDLREAVTTLEDVARIARRVLGTAHPLTTAIERDLLFMGATLRARETPSARA